MRVGGGGGGGVATTTAESSAASESESDPEEDDDEEVEDDDDDPEDEEDDPDRVVDAVCLGGDRFFLCLALSAAMSKCACRNEELVGILSASSASGDGAGVCWLPPSASRL